MTRSPPISPPTSATRCSRAMPTASTGSAWTFKRMRVVDLRAEHVIGLLGTEEARPRLSWRIESDARGAVPTHYRIRRSEEHTSELQSLMRSSYAAFCLKKKKIAHKRH